MRTVLFFLLGIALMANRCESDTVKQGIAGKVLWLEGNQMPGIINEDQPELNPKRQAPRGIAREVHIYELTSMGQATSKGVFFSDLKTKLLEKVKTDEDGNFSVSLPEGQYSLFVKEEEGLFASQMDGQGNINPIEVKKDQVTPVTIEVNYKAAY